MTETAIEWISDAPVLGEAELVKRAIAFANSLDAYPPFASPSADYYPIDIKTGARIGVESTATEEAREKQAALRAALVAILDRKKRAPLEQAAQWCAAASAVVTVSSFRMEGRRLRAEVYYRTATRVVESGLGSLLSLALCLLLDSKRPYGRDLCRCRVCGVFFLAAPPKKQGRRRTLFCSSEHQKESERAKTRKRVHNWYARRAKHK